MADKYTAKCKSFVTVNTETENISTHRPMGSVHRCRKRHFILDQEEFALIGDFFSVHAGPAPFRYDVEPMKRMM